MGSVHYGCGTFRMLHILCPFLLLEEYLFTNQKSPLILVLVNLSVWIFPYTQCHATSFPYLDLTMWLKFLADLVSLILSCLLDLGLIHQSWLRGGDLFWPSTSGKHESLLKLTKARQEMPNEASNVNTSQAIGKVTK